MKKIRIPVLLCAVLMILSAVQPVFAAPAPALPSLTRVIQGNNYFLANKEKKTFYVFPRFNYGMYDSKGERWDDLVFDTGSVVSGRSGAKWVKILDIGQDFMIDIKPNKTQKMRTGKVTVSGKGYSATLTFKQFGVDNITYAKRNKKTVTLKFSFAKGTKYHRLNVSRYKLDGQGGVDESTYESIFNGPVSAKSYKFKVKKGYRYYYNLGPAVRYEAEWDPGVYFYDAGFTASGYFDVTRLTGSQGPDESVSVSDWK